MTNDEATFVPSARKALEILLVPTGGLGRCIALLDGKAITKPTRLPFLDAALALLELGYDPDTVLCSRYRCSKIIARCSTIGEAAAWKRAVQLGRRHQP